MRYIIFICGLLFNIGCSQLDKNKPNANLEWYKPENETPQYQCPVCDYVTLAERGSFLICPVCYWEDDGLGISELDVQSGPNIGLTIREGRENFNSLGACEQNMIQYVLSKDKRKKYKHIPRQL